MLLVGRDAMNAVVLVRPAPGRPAAEALLGQSSSTKPKKRKATKGMPDKDAKDDALSYWVSAGTIPTHVVEDPNFRHFVELLDPEVI